jgi:hypothetical protein
MELASVSLTNPNLDLLDYPQTLIGWLRRLSSFFSRWDIPWYVQSGLAVRLYGMSDRNVTDLDIRAHWQIADLYEKFRRYIDCTVTLRPPVRYEQGEFRNSCIMVEIPELSTRIDITTEINTYRRDSEVLFRIPFDHNSRRLGIHPNYSDRFPVCSLEYLIIYKLVHSRGKSENKNDQREAAALLRVLKDDWKHRA